MRPTTRTLLIFLLGVVVGRALWGVAWVMAAGGHGTGLGFIVLFPWAEFLYRTALFSEHTWALGILSFLQIPLYAVLLGVLWDKRRHFYLAVAVLLALHLVAVACCFLPDAFYQAFWF